MSLVRGVATGRPPALRTGRAGAWVVLELDAETMFDPELSFGGTSDVPLDEALHVLFEPDSSVPFLRLGAVDGSL